MQKIWLLAALCAVSVPVRAQPDHFTTAPEGYDYVEGDSDSRDLLGTEPLLRYQQIDGTILTDLQSRNKMAFRRDGRLPDNFDYLGRTIELEVVFSESDLASISTNFAANYKTNTTTVVSRKKIAFADWSFAPTVLPGGVTNVLALDQLWSYLGRPASGNDFLWEVRVWSNTMAGKDYPFDLEYVVPNATFGTQAPAINGGVQLSAGCAIGAAAPFDLQLALTNTGSALGWQSDTYFGTPGAPVALLLDGIDQQLQLPGLCSTVHALAMTIPHGIADGAGHTSVGFNLPYRRSLLGATLFAQAATPDLGQPGTAVALTGGLSATVPADPAPPKVGRLWALDPNATTATTGPLPGGIIIWTNHQ